MRRGDGRRRGRGVGKTRLSASRGSTFRADARHNSPAELRQSLADPAHRAAVLSRIDSLPPPPSPVKTDVLHGRSIKRIGSAS